MAIEESERVELKKSTSELKEGIISIASILNKHKSGRLYLGIRNDGTVLGQSVTDNTLREISKAIGKRIYDACKQASVKIDFVKVVFFRPVKDILPNGGLNGGVNFLLKYIKDNPGKRLPLLSQALAKPEKTVEKWLQKLREQDKIEFRGSPKTGGYFAR